MVTKETVEKKGILARAYHRAFNMGALRPHVRTLLPFFNSPGGKFVEIGARDGVKESFTPYLEKALGWQGILIEPWPHLFLRCKKSRRTSVALNVAASEKLLRDSYIEIVGDPSTASVRRTLIKEAKERVEGKPVTAPLPGQAVRKKVHYVSTNSISGILDRANFDTQFELIIFNLPGYEAHALDGMDFDKYKPTFLLIRAESDSTSLPSLPPYYQRITASNNGDGTAYHLFRYADFGSN